MIPDQVERTSRVRPLRQTWPGMRGIFNGEIGNGTSVCPAADQRERKLADEAVPRSRFERVELRLLAVAQNGKKRHGTNAHSLIDIAGHVQRDGIRAGRQLVEG